MFSWPYWPTWVRWVIDYKDSSLSIDLFLKWREVNFPIFLGEKLIVSDFDLEVLANGVQQGEPRSGNYDVISLLAHDTHNIVKSLRTTHRQEDILSLEGSLWLTELVNHCLLGWRSSIRGSVPIECLLLTNIFDCILHWLGKREPVVFSWLT